MWIAWLVLWIFAGLPFLGGLFKIIEKNQRTSERIDMTGLKICTAIKMILAFIVGIVTIVGGNVPDATMTWCIIIFSAIFVLIEAWAFNTMKIGATVTVLFVILLILVINVAATAGYNNAVYFDQFVQKGTGIPINSEIPDNRLRLTSETLATYIASQHSGEFGSNTKIISTHIILFQGRLVWVNMVAKQANWGTYKIAEGLIIVDANNPDADPVIIRQRFDIAEGLSFNPIPMIDAYGNAHAKGYYSIGTDKTYGKIYATLDPDGKWVSIMTTYTPDMSNVRHLTDIYVLDTRGNIIDEFDPTQVPQWISQPYDENDFLEGGINDWGNYRIGDGFSWWAPGYLGATPSADRVAITEDTRFIFDPDLTEVVGIDQVHPIKQEGAGTSTLAGVFKQTHEGIFYYDLSQMSLISGDTAGAAAVTKVTAGGGQGTKYYTEGELLYPLVVGTNTTLVYFVPIYAETETATGQKSVRLHALAIVDAHNQNNAVVVFAGPDLMGADLVAETKVEYRAAQHVEVAGIAISGTVTKIFTYSLRGNQIWEITIRTTDNRTLTVSANVRDILAMDNGRKTLDGISYLKEGDSVKVIVDSNYNLQGFA